MKKRLPLLLICILGFAIISNLNTQRSAQASPTYTDRADMKLVQIDPAVKAFIDSAQPDEMLTVVVTLRQQAGLSSLPGADRAARQRAVIQTLQATANATQGPLTGILKVRRDQGSVSSFEPLWIFNGFSVTATAGVIDELSQHPDVQSLSSDNIPVVLAGSASPEPNISVINAPSLWGQGSYGQGIVVASMDTGVDVNHPDLTARWRGGNNSWFDPYGQHDTPVDLSGHGTQTMGLMVGGDAGGTAIGVAPQAKWIAVKMFNDAGASTVTAIHEGFQWFLDPDGDPQTADAPWVINNSWSLAYPGCNLEFQLDLQALVAADITPVFAAGNFGPSNATSVSPANYPEAFAVGATNNNDQIYAYSSRGPSACGESDKIYPEMVAPGVNVRTSDLYSLYTQTTGTSLSAPAVSGALALLLSAYPNLTVAQQETALTTTAIDLGPSGPDNKYGFGRLDALAAYQWLASGGASTVPTPTPTATVAPSPTPTATPTATPTVTPTATPSNAGTVHIGDLDDTSTTAAHKKWNASIGVLVHDASDLPLAGAIVYGTWSDGVSGDASCLTGANGRCTLSANGVLFKTPAVTFTISDVVQGSLTYSAGLNHDPDGDSDGTTILLSMP